MPRDNPYGDLFQTPNPFDMRCYGEILNPSARDPLMNAYRGVNFDAPNPAPTVRPGTRRPVEDPNYQPTLDRLLSIGGATQAY